jgi:metal-dependent amidase/aminoacylase/carboxypeptidase family protein
VAGEENGGAGVMLVPKVTGSEDFSYFQRLVPGLFFFIGSTAPGIDPAHAPSNHSPLYAVDENCLLPGLRALTHLACDFLEAQPRA